MYVHVYTVHHPQTTTVEKVYILQYIGYISVSATYISKFNKGKKDTNCKLNQGCDIIKYVIYSLIFLCSCTTAPAVPYLIGSCGIHVDKMMEYANYFTAYYIARVLN